MKGISAVIAAILMLMITMSLVGVSYFYISGIFTSKTTLIEAVWDTDVTKPAGTGCSITWRIKNSGINPVTITISPVNEACSGTEFLPSGLVGYWKFDENSGDIAKDSSRNNNYGNLRPACPDCPSWTDGKYGKALRFDGVDDYVDVGSGTSLAVTSAVTAEAWVKPTSLTGYPQVVMGGNYKGYLLRVSQNGNARLTPHVYTNTYYAASGATVIPLNQWTHVGMTYDGTTVRGYINGVEDVSFVPTVGGNMVSSTTGTQIGKEVGIGEGYFNGIIDEVGIYNRALSADEIKTLYETGPSLTTNLAAGEIKEIIVNDCTENRNHLFKAIGPSNTINLQAFCP